MKYMPWITLFSLIFTLSASVEADTLLLRSGDQCIGTIISMNDQEIEIDVNGVPLRIQRSDVVEIIRKESPGLTFPPFVSTIPDQSTPEIQTPAQNPWSADNRMALSQNVESATPQPLLPVILPPGRAFQVIGAGSRGARFRKGPGLDNELIASLLEYTILVELEFVDNWLHAKTMEGVEGWIHPSSVRPMQNLPCLVIGDRLHVRESPDDLSLSRKRLRSGDVVVKLEERAGQGDWWYILCNDSKVGWCNKNYLLPLEDDSQYRPVMRTSSNADLGTPVLVDRRQEGPGMQQVTFIVRDPSFTISGKTRLIILHRDPVMFTNENLTYVSESIVQRDRMENSSAILKTGFPGEIAVEYIGGDLLTLLGERVQNGWSYSVLLPESTSISFGFIVQKGPNRGTLILIQ